MDSSQVPIIAVASGKGGVGKSSVAVAIGRELARSGRRAGLVDADIAGRDVPRMLGLRRDVPARSITLARWAPWSSTCRPASASRSRACCPAPAGWRRSWW